MPGNGNVGATLDSVPGHARLQYSGEVAGETLDLWLLNAGAHEGVDSSVLDDVDSSVLDDVERRAPTPCGRRTSSGAICWRTPPSGNSSARRSACRPGTCALCGSPAPDAGGRRSSCPQRIDASLHFSLSSSKHLVLLALASASVGVDVEAIPSRRAVDEASALLHPAEREELRHIDPEDRRATFTRLWSTKEAYLKGIGVGVAHGLGEYVGTRPQAATPEGWTLLDVAVPPGFAGSAALRTGSTLRDRRAAADVERHDQGIRTRRLVVPADDAGLCEPGALVQPSRPDRCRGVRGGSAPIPGGPRQS